MLPSTPQVYEIAATCFLVSNIAVNLAAKIKLFLD